MDVEACRNCPRSADDQSQSGIHRLAEWIPGAVGDDVGDIWRVPTLLPLSLGIKHLCNSCSQTCNRLHYASVGVVLNRGRLRGDTPEMFRGQYEEKLHVMPRNHNWVCIQQLHRWQWTVQKGSGNFKHKDMWSVNARQHHLTSCQYQHADLTSHGYCCIDINNILHHTEGGFHRLKKDEIKER